VRTVYLPSLAAAYAFIDICGEAGCKAFLIPADTLGRA